jgi:hypothetical protein
MVVRQRRLFKHVLFAFSVYIFIGHSYIPTHMIENVLSYMTANFVSSVSFTLGLSAQHDGPPAFYSTFTAISIRHGANSFHPIIIDVITMEKDTVSVAHRNIVTTQCNQL